ncbi:ventral expressed homeobox [Sander vitreus]
MGGFGKGSRSQYSPTSPNNSCGYTSGSESEVGDDSEGEATQQRRMRTKFTSEQISKLEKAFCKHRYLGAMQRRKTADKLNLSETQVKTWFQNRRMKLKREVQDLRPDFLSVPTALLFQHPALSGQLPGLCGQFPAGSGFFPQLRLPRRPLHTAALAAPLHQHHQPRPHPAIMPPHFY